MTRIQRDERGDVRHQHDAGDAGHQGELAPLDLVPRTDEDVRRLERFSALQPALLARHQRERRAAAASNKRRSAHQRQQQQQQQRR